MKKTLIVLSLSILINTFLISVYANSNKGIWPLISENSKVDEKDIDAKNSDEKKKPIEEKIDESKYDSVHLGELLKNPTSYLKKNVKFRGEFSSFVTLALDYKPAFRDSKDYISFAIFRPKTQIPLSELKLAFPVEKAKDNKTLTDLGKGDLIEMFGTVFSDALGEPWVDVVAVKMLKPAPDKKKNKSDDSLEDQMEME